MPKRRRAAATVVRRIKKVKRLAISGVTCVPWSKAQLVGNFSVEVYKSRIASLRSKKIIFAAADRRGSMKASSSENRSLGACSY